jgi:hypothetical protein
MGMAGRLVAGVAALLVLGGCGTSQAPGTSANGASLLKVAFKAGGTYRYHYSSRLDARTAVGQSFSLPIKADASGDATWKIVSVDAGGDTTVHVTLSNLKATSTSSLPPGSTTSTTTTTTDREFQFTVAPTGEVVSGGNPAALAPPISSPQGMLPGSDQFLAILPDRPVGPGDTWTKSFTRPGPFGQGSVTYTTTNRFLRYENFKSGRAAVIETTTTIPLDLDMPGPNMIGSPTSPSLPQAGPASGGLHIQGSTTTVSTTWFDTKTGQVEKVISVGTTDSTSTSTGALLPVPVPSMLPGIGAVPPGPLGPVHVTARQTTEFDLLS